MKTKILLTIGILLTAAVGTNATMIDFEGLAEFYKEAPYTYLEMSSYGEDGYTLTTTADFGIAEIYPPRHIVMTSGPEMGTIEITKDDGGTFDLISADFSCGSSQIITITGRKFNGLTVEKIIAFDEPTGFSTYSFNSFTGLVSVSWNSDLYFAFDNIVLIPEPTVFLLLLLGGVFLRRFNH